MKINVVLFPPTNRSDMAIQIFDFYYAYRQWCNRHKSYKSDIEIVITHDQSIDPGAVNIAWFHMPNTIQGVEDFDLIFVDNSQHHLEVCTESMYRALNQLPNCYITSGATVDESHPYYEKIIGSPMVYNNRDYYNRPFYPQYHEKYHNQDRKPLFFINGKNRTNRQYLAELIETKLGSKIAKHNISPSTKLLDSFFETVEDTEFRNFVNNRIVVSNSVEQIEQLHHDGAVSIGINSCFGSIPPGYFMLDQYREYHCVVFPETTWLNDEIFLTEKIIKCFVSESIPFPVAGANTNSLYNQLGYLTAWNLLPDVLKLFDQEKNHAKRYNMAVDAMAWLADNPQVFDSPMAEKIKQNNFYKFFTQNDDIYCVKKLDKLFEKYKK